MNTTEHLEKIKAKCLANLAIAEKRTAGNWHRWTKGCTVQIGLSSNPSIRPHIVGWTGFDSCGLALCQQKKNAAYIAACAGAAEAGWRSTIAAIDEFNDLSDWGASCRDFANKALDRIIAAWPEELL